MILYTIVEYSNSRITYKDFINHLKSVYCLDEEFLFEIPKFDDHELNLPTEIWIDGDRDMPHQRRIKFNDKNSSNSNTWASMTIDKYEPKVFNLSPKTTLSNKDIEIIKNFVRTNYVVLMQIADGLITDKEIILKNLNIDREPSDLLQMDDNKINLELNFNSKTNILYFIVQKNDEKSLKYIEELSKIKHFDNYDKFAAYLNIFNLKGDAFQKKNTVLNILKNTANKLDLKVNVINLNVFNTIEYHLNKLKIN